MSARHELVDVLAMSVVCMQTFLTPRLAKESIIFCR